MTGNVERAAREFYSGTETAPSNIKFFFRTSENVSAEQLADYLLRAETQLRNDTAETVPDHEM